MLARLTLHLALLSLSWACCSTTDDALVTPGPAAGPVVPAVPADAAVLLRYSTALLNALLTRRYQPRRHLRSDLLFWAARGKRPASVHYWDVPQASMTSATIRRFLGLPSQRQREWQERIDNSIDNGNDDDEEEEELGQAEVDDEEAPSAASEGYLSERGKKEFWATRGKKGGGGDFWASRGKKDGRTDFDFWASRGKRGGGLAARLDTGRISTLPLLKTSRQQAEDGRHWAE